MAFLHKQKIFAAGFPKIVCLCGSGRFMDTFNMAEETETMAGHIVLTIGCNTKDAARDPGFQKYKPALDELHKRKIDLCDEVYVLNVGGYIGDSTRSEIEYAQAHGKPIRFLEGGAPAPPMITHASSYPGDRAGMYCVCSVCGHVGICTPDFDYYAEPGDPLVCQNCFVRRAGLPLVLTDMAQERDREWAHALMTAVEEHYPLPGREWREWPTSPDVESMCDWLRRLLEEDRIQTLNAIKKMGDE